MTSLSPGKRCQMPTPLVDPHHAPALHLCRAASATLATAIVLVVPVALSSGALAAPTPGNLSGVFRSEVESSRSQSSCKPLQYNHVVEQAAAVVNKSTVDYLDHNSNQVPIADPKAGLKDLGFPVGKTKLLLGADEDYRLAMKGAILEGYAALADCSYTDFATDVRRDGVSGKTLVLALLTGP